MRARHAQVFATCGSAAKRAALLDAFPGLREDHLGSSRDTSFEALVKTATDGVGVDLVLNSLAGDKLQAGPPLLICCLALVGAKATPKQGVPALQQWHCAKMRNKIHAYYHGSESF